MGSGDFTSVAGDAFALNASPIFLVKSKLDKRRQTLRDILRLQNVLRLIGHRL
jgi:hypothetical protein